MCDTMVAMGNATADGSVLFAKNSDREPNEAQSLILIPHATHANGSKLNCTYVEIPQVEETNAILLSQPCWIWGGEIGVNEHGVAIGNEAVFTKVAYKKDPGLIGMDFLRLALERAATAYQAMEVITKLLETYGQGGNCGFAHKLYYHNSFLIADRKEAWVLETAGRQWAAEQVHDVRSISNAITIGSKWDLASDGLVDYAIEQRWCKGKDDFDFGRCYSDFLYTRFSDGRKRQRRTSELLEINKGRISVATMMAILRDHGPDASAEWTPGHGIAGADVCMHAGFGPIRVSHTTGSMISRLMPQVDTHWVTGTSTPCTGIFKPVWIDAGLPDLGPMPSGHYDKAALWWRHEILHREVLRDYATRISLYRDDRDTLEDRFLREAGIHAAKGVEERAAFSRSCFIETDEATSEWIHRVREAELKSHLPVYYALAWRGFNREARLSAN